MQTAQARPHTDRTVAASTPWATPEARRQALARRNDRWLHDHELGRMDLRTRKVRRYSVIELALEDGVTPRAVRYGMDEARAVRELIAHALAS